jgi:hypothetical protein
MRPVGTARAPSSDTVNTPLVAAAPDPDPVTEIQRLLGELESFDREIADLEARPSGDCIDRIYLTATRTARWATEQALDAWMTRIDAGAC